MLSFAGFAVEFVIVAIILILQFYFFGANVKKRKELESIFPDNVDEHLSAVQNEEGETQVVVNDLESELLQEEIIVPINSYLDKNKGATDYHIIKDLTDRACDKVQDEVDSYNPVPLYLGLCGTMLGIILGIVFLWLNGGLDALLPSADISKDLTAEAAKALEEATREKASNGIQHLLGGVAIAMIASLTGVILTIIGTHQTKKCVASNETGRNVFLSWIQCNLLPKMSSDVVSTLGNFHQNLSQFNRTFSDNSKELQKAFEVIKSAYSSQTEYTKELNKLDIAKAQMAFAALGSATDKINDLNAFLSHSSQYLADVVALSQKLDAADQRTKAIEGMGEFFRNEIQQINTRKALLSETVGQIDLNLQNSLKGLETTTNQEVAKLTEHLNKIYIDFQHAVEEQQRLLTEKLSESSLYLEQFQHLETIEQKLGTLLTSEVFSQSGEAQLAKLEAQNGKLDSIERALNRIIEIVSKKSVAAPAHFADSGLFDNQQKDMKVSVKLPIPKWFAYTTCGVVIAAGLAAIAFIIIKLFAA